ncbi:MAG: cell wall-associated NlpC family hydrolase [Paracoccaceae bacterium]|jgi:cell wall-associated NlpC family hydrolase
MDKRTTPFNGCVAHSSLLGQIDAPCFSDGQEMQICASVVDLWDRPAGARQRQLLFGDSFLVLDQKGHHAFGQSQKDDYCGYIDTKALSSPSPQTHWVASPASHLYSAPKIQAHELMRLNMGARVQVIAEGESFFETPQGYVPKHHVRALGNWHADPVAVAQIFLGTPYLWGGNTRNGLDCSGLVQTALLACGISCPADSDLQQSLGKSFAEKTPLKRGDLLFWKGHVAMVVNADVILHATGSFMAVAVENAKTAPARILAAGDGHIIARRRLSQLFQ